MDMVYHTFDKILTDLFNQISEIEEKALISEEFKDISNHDMHIIAAIGLDAPKNMTAVAKTVGVTVSTLTIAMNSLVKKGYVNRVRSQKDRRVVLTSLSKKGIRAFEHHRSFHELMIKAALKGLHEEDQAVILRVLNNLTDFFQETQAQSGVQKDKPGA